MSQPPDAAPAGGGRPPLLAVVDALGGQRSLDEVVTAVARSAAVLTSARGSAVAVFGGPGAAAGDAGGTGDTDAEGHAADRPAERGVAAFAAAGEEAADGPRARLHRLHRLEQARAAAPAATGAGADALLAVPVPDAGGTGDTVGALYVRGRADGTFAAEDRDVLEVLAQAVSTAVHADRLRRESEARQRWLTATAEIGAQLLVHAGEDPLRLIARRAFELSDADLVSIALLTDDGEAIVIEESVGRAGSDILGRRFPVGETMGGKAILERRALLADSAGLFEGLGRHGANLRSVIDVGPIMALPLIGTERVRGSMTITRVVGRAPFSETDLALASGFATHASVALELADSRAAEQRVVLLEDRDRIARDLHDHVIQELFAIGLSLQSVATGLGPDSDAGARIAARVEDLDRTIRRIRTSIFELRGPDRGARVRRGEGLRESAQEIAADLTPALGFTPLVTVGDQVSDAAVDDDLHADVTAVLREGLTNIAKHAHATRASVDLEMPTGELVVTVSDDGVGLQDGGRRSGTANLRIRAERRGGTFDVSSAPAGGTLLVWRVPIR